MNRNDLCRCGSGKKFKKCCEVPSPSFFINSQPTLIAYLLIFIASMGVRIGSSGQHFFASYDPGYRNFEFFDSNYQARRTEMILKDYPHVSFFDRYHYYPDNPRIPWPTGYNLFLASVVKPFDLVFHHNRAINETMEGLVPCVIDSITALLFLWLFSQFISFPIAVVASLLFCLSYVNIQYAEIGCVDHHYFITFMNAVFAVLMLKFYRQASLSSALALGFALGSAIFFNVSSIQYVLFYLLSLLGIVFTQEADPKLARQSLWVYLSCFLIAFASGLSTPAGREFLVKYDETSMFQPLLILLASAGALIILIWKNRLQLSSALKKTLAFSFLAALGILFVLLFDKICLNLVEGAVFLLHGNILNGTQGEEASVFKYAPAALFIYTWGVLLVPFGVTYLFKKRSQFQFLFTLFVVFFFYGSICALGHLAYVQFFYPWYALVVSIGLFVVVEQIAAQRLNQQLLVGFFFLQPLYMIGSFNFNLSGIKTETRQAMGETIASFAWLREHSPSTSGHDLGTGEPEYSVFARRDYGHLLIRHAHRPAMISPFSTPDFLKHMVDYSRYIFSETEEEVISILDRYRSRYLVVDTTDDGLLSFYFHVLYQEVPEDLSQYRARASLAKMPSLFRDQLVFFDGQKVLEKGHATEHFRLIYEVPSTLKSQVPVDGHLRVIQFNALKLFEKVRGAKVVGRLKPGSTIDLELPLITNTGRNLTYRQTVVADQEGRFTFIVPYGTERVDSRTSVFPVQPFAVIRSAGKTKPVSISEKSIQLGESVEVSFP